MRAKKSPSSQIFQETEDFIKGLDKIQCNPPYFNEVFTLIRSRSYQMLTRKKSDNKLEGDELVEFIEKFEFEFVDILRTKLREKYSAYILRKNYNVSSDVDFNHLKNVGAVEEMRQLSLLIADWSIELELLYYTLEGLKLYGLHDPTPDKQKEFAKILKPNLNYGSSTRYNFINEYMSRKIIRFILARVSNMAFLSGLTKTRFTSQIIVQIILIHFTTKKVPWALVASCLNIPYILGGFAFSLVLNKVKQVMDRNQAVSNLQVIYQRFEKNKLYLMSERKTLLECALGLITNKEVNREVYEKKIESIINHLLNPPDESKGVPAELSAEEIELLFMVKEIEDYVLVEERDHQETKDESGVVVVDW